MRLDPKYFNKFLAIAAFAACCIIIFFTFHNRSSDKQAFKKRMFAQDSLRTIYWTKADSSDSVRVSDIKNKYVMLDFWSTWSDGALASHKALAKLAKQYPDRLTIIAAAVDVKQQKLQKYIQKYAYPFFFTVGTKAFLKNNIPGLPAQFLYNPSGKLSKIYLGFPGPEQYDHLKSKLRETDQ